MYVLVEVGGFGGKLVDVFVYVGYLVDIVDVMYVVDVIVLLLVG